MLRAMRLAGNIPLISANVPRLSDVNYALENFNSLSDSIGDMTGTDKATSSTSSTSSSTGKKISKRDSKTSTADRAAEAVCYTSTSSTSLLEYEFGFYKAMATFKHQLIFDTRTRTVSRKCMNYLERESSL